MTKLQVSAVIQTLSHTAETPYRDHREATLSRQACKQRCSPEVCLRMRVPHELQPTGLSSGSPGHRGPGGLSSATAPLLCGLCVTGTRANCCESLSGRILLFFLVALLWHRVQRAVGPGNLLPYLVNQGQGPSSEQGASRPGSASPRICLGTWDAASGAAVRRGSPHFPPWWVALLRAFPSKLPGLFKSSTNTTAHFTKGTPSGCSLFPPPLCSLPQILCRTKCKWRRQTRRHLPMWHQGATSPSLRRHPGCERVRSTGPEKPVSGRSVGPSLRVCLMNLLGCAAPGNQRHVWMQPS